MEGSGGRVRWEGEVRRKVKWEGGRVRRKGEVRGEVGG